MKLSKFSLLIIVIFTITTMFCACGDEDNDKLTPITLKDREDTTIKLTYPNNEKLHYIIQGGDGNYSVKADNPEVVWPEIIKPTDISASKENLSLLVIGLGSTKVTITDKSNNSLILDIIVDYLTNEFTIRLIEVRVTGGDLTENQKKAIIEKQIARNPVKVGGGYKFILNDLTNKKGEAIIYPDIYGGGTTSKAIFNVVENIHPSIPDSFHSGYALTINNEKRIFALGSYSPMPKYTPVRPVALIEDVTETVQKEYPKAELVLVYQAIQM